MYILSYNWSKRDTKRAKREMGIYLWLWPMPSCLPL